MNRYVPLTPERIAQLNAWLVEAEDALHLLRVGGQVQRLVHGQKDIVYSKGDVGVLAAYVGDLRTQLGLPGGRGRATRLQPDNGIRFRRC